MKLNKNFFNRASTWVNLGAIASVVLANMDYFDLSNDVQGYIRIACGVAVAISQSYSMGADDA